MMANFTVALSHLGGWTRYAMVFALAALALSLLLAAWRLLRGPNAVDRILALDTIYVNALALTILLGIVFATTVYFEVALVIAMLGFAGTVVLAKHLDRKGIVE